MKIKLIALCIGIMLSAAGMQPRLKNFNYKAASVLPYTRWKPQGQAYFLLSREAYGPDKGTYDAFGGKRDPQENHPVITASREFVEESAQALFRTTSQARRYIDTSKLHTHTVVAHKGKKVVYYLTKFSSIDADKLVRNFYKNIAQPHRPFDQKEKDRLAWVSWNNLEKAIANAPRTTQGNLTFPITVIADVVDRNGIKNSQKITLRPILVYALEPFLCKKKPSEIGRDKRIKFYK